MARIIGWCVLLACVYGVIHDQVTARVFLPYFTEFHPKLGIPEDPTLIGLAWGVIATWWVGAILGFFLGLVCTRGSRPPLTMGDLRWPLGILFVVMGLCAAVAGWVGYSIDVSFVAMVFPLVRDLAPPMQHRFAADLFAHNASYAVGTLGGVTVVLWAWIVRGRQVDHPQ